MKTGGLADVTDGCAEFIGPWAWRTREKRAKSTPREYAACAGLLRGLAEGLRGGGTAWGGETLGDRFTKGARQPSLSGFAQLLIILDADAGSCPPGTPRSEKSDPRCGGLVARGRIGRTVRGGDGVHRLRGAAAVVWGTSKVERGSGG